MGVAQRQPLPAPLGTLSILCGGGLWGHLSGRAWESPPVPPHALEAAQGLAGGRGETTGMGCVPESWEGRFEFSPPGSSRTRMLQDLGGERAPLPFAPGPAPPWPGSWGPKLTACLVLKVSSQPPPEAELCAQGSSALSRHALTTTRAVPAWLEVLSFIVGFPAPETGGTGQNPHSVTHLTGQLSLHCPQPSSSTAQNP